MKLDEVLDQGDIQILAKRFKYYVQDAYGLGSRMVDEVRDHYHQNFEDSWRDHPTDFIEFHYDVPRECIHNMGTAFRNVGVDISMPVGHTIWKPFSRKAEYEELIRQVEHTYKSFCKLDGWLIQKGM